MHGVITGFTIEDGLFTVTGKTGDGLIPLEVAYSLYVVAIIVGEEKQVNITRSLSADDSRQHIKVEMMPQYIGMPRLVKIINS